MTAFLETNRPTPAAPPVSFADMEGKTFDDLSADIAARVRSSLEEPCLMCGGIGRWSSHYRDALFTAPAGHRLEYIQGPHLIVLDSCRNHLAI